MESSLTIKIAAMFLLFSHAISIPFDGLKESTKFEEIADMNKILKNADDINSSSKTLSHNDGDEDVAPILLKNVPNLKYDVEILESGDLKRENDGVEEHFRGAALHMDTNLFTDEDIEVHKMNDPRPFSYLSLMTVFSIFGMSALIIYAVLITWRHKLEQRYGQRVLLVGRCDEDDDFSRERNDGSNDRQQIPMVEVY